MEIFAIVQDWSAVLLGLIGVVIALLALLFISGLWYSELRVENAYAFCVELILAVLLLIYGVYLARGLVHHSDEVEVPPTLKQIIVVDTESAATLATIEGRCTVDELATSIEVICSVGDGEKRLVFENASYKISSGRGKVSADYYRVEYPADTPSE